MPSTSLTTTLALFGLLLPCCGLLPQTGPQEFPAPPVVEGEKVSALVPSVVLKGIKQESTLAETQPYLRYQHLADGRYKVLVPMPLGSLVNLDSGPAKVVKDNCHCFTRADRPATIQVEQGYVVRGDPSKSPWESANTFQATEDLLILTGTVADIREALEFIDLYYNNAPQVEIQAQIVQVNDTDAFERGIDGLNLQNIKDGVPYLGSGADGPALREITYDHPLDSGGGFALSIIKDSMVLSAVLQMVATTSSADIVSRPRVVVRNGQAAYLASSERIPYQKYTALVVGSGTSTSTLDFLDVGIDLKVLPVIVGSDTVHLSIDAQVSRTGRNVEISGESVPVTTDRSAKTVLSVRSGQSVVIGGLKLLETRNVESKIPLLGSIPLLGWLFSYESAETIDTEVLFIITPVIKTRAASISRFGDIFDPFSEDAQP